MNKITILAFIITLLLSCSSKDDKIYKALKEDFTKRRTDLLDKYESTNLDYEYFDRDFILSIDVEKKISSSSGLIYGTVVLNDIILKDSTYIVKFDPDFWMNTNFYFTLDCSMHLANKLLDAQLDDFDVISIVAKIYSIKKFRFDITNISDDDFASIEIYSSNAFNLRGELIDFEYLK